MKTYTVDEMRRAFADSVDALGLPGGVNASFDALYLPIARCLVDARTEYQAAPYILGVNGAQGSGKSTFCHLLAEVLRIGFGQSVLVLSIDDLYHSRAHRMELSETVHPLCLYRGVPGTHDTEIGRCLFETLDAASPQHITWVPRFDKSQDDRAPKEQWTQWIGRPDFILFEGWCVGASPPPPWTGPLNERERNDDPEGIWARWSTQCHREAYDTLFGRIQRLLMIQVESMDSVRQGRWLQEKTLRERLGITGDDADYPGVMTKTEVDAYVDLFERYTTHMLRELPSKADILVTRSNDLRYTLVRTKKHESMGGESDDTAATGIHRRR